MSVDHTKTIISVKNVSYAYGSTSVLEKVSLDVHQGDYLGVIGPNGGGKTTLVKLMLGLLQPDAGEIHLFGQPVAKFKQWSKIGYVAQKATTFDRFFPVTVRDVVAMGRLPHQGLIGSQNGKDKQLIQEALEQVGLQDVADRLLGNLSGGQQQRVFIARALAQQAEVIFLDEPTTGVDVETQEEFYRLLRHLNQKLGITLIFVTHEQDVVRKEVTEVACVNRHLNYHGSSSGFLKSSAFTQMYGEDMRAVHHHHD